MSIGIVMLIALMILVIAITSGVPMPLVFAGSAVFIVLVMQIEPRLVIQVGYSSVSSYVLLAIPLFIIGGVLMSQSRIGENIVDWFDCFLGRIKGSMTIISTCAFALFGAVSGSGMAVLSCLGSLLFPKMVEKGYSPSVTAAMLCCSAPLGLLIPPSITQILFAWAANVSVLGCFLAIVVPGLMTAAMIALVSMILIRRTAVDLVVSEQRQFKDWGKHTIITTGKSIPGLMMPVIILGGIYSGIMTITESAAVAAVYAIVIAIFVYKDISLRSFTKVISEAGVTSGVIMLGIFFIIPFSRLLLQEGVPQMVLDTLLSVSDQKWIILLMINVFMILMGMVLDDTCGVLIVATILTPIVGEIGVSPYHFAAIVGVNLGFGLITPPTAPFLYFTSRITGVPVANMIKPVLIIIACCYLPALMLTTYIPQVSLWLPELLLANFSAF